MITIEELEEMDGTLKSIMKSNSDLYEQQKEALTQLMEKYQPVAKWYSSNGHINIHEYTREIGFQILLSEDQEYVYYWDPRKIEISRFDKTQHRNKGAYSPSFFVKQGHFEEAKLNILNLDSDLQNKLNDIEIENKKLNDSLK